MDLAAAEEMELPPELIFLHQQQYPVPVDQVVLGDLEAVVVQVGVDLVSLRRRSLVLVALADLEEMPV